MVLPNLITFICSTRKQVRYEHRRESGIGSFVHFVELHRSRMNDENYAIPIKQQFSKRVHSLMSERCLGMLKSLRLGLNHYSHSNDPMDPHTEARLVELLKNIGWSNTWDSKRLGVKISEFINELYDVGGGLSSRVPVLMEVVAITETPTARLAELTSLRTKSKPPTSTSTKRIGRGPSYLRWTMKISSLQTHYASVID